MADGDRANGEGRTTDSADDVERPGSALVRLRQLALEHLPLTLTAIFYGALALRLIFITGSPTAALEVARQMGLVAISLSWLLYVLPFLLFMVAGTASGAIRLPGRLSQLPTPPMAAGAITGLITLMLPLPMIGGLALLLVLRWVSRSSPPPLQRKKVRDSTVASTIVWFVFTLFVPIAPKEQIVLSSGQKLSGVILSTDDGGLVSVFDDESRSIRWINGRIVARSLCELSTSDKIMGQPAMSLFVEQGGRLRC